MNGYMLSVFYVPDISQNMIDIWCLLKANKILWRFYIALEYSF